MPRSPAGRMDFVLALHSHLPYVLNHGRWPHGSDWLCEAALETYLPLLEALRALADDGVAAPVTIGFTPVLANQLVHPTFAAELDAWAAANVAGLHGHDVDATCRTLVRKLGEGGWLQHAVGDRIDTRAICLLRETLGRHNGLADFAFAM